MGVKRKHDPSSPAFVETVEEFMKLYKSRPSIEEVQAAMYMLQILNRHQQMILEEISKQEKPYKDVPEELFSMLQAVRRTTVLFQSYERKKEAAYVVMLDKMFHTFDDLVQKLDQVVSIGFEKELAAEALGRNENDTEKALDDLTNPETNCSIQVDIESRKRKRHRQAIHALVETLVGIGFERSRVVATLQAGGTMQEALCRLLAEGAPNPTVAAHNSSQAGAISAAADISHIMHQNNEVGGPSNATEAGKRDAELEGELADELAI